MEDQYYDVEKYKMSNPQGTKNTIAIVGFVMSIVSLFTCCAFSVVSIILCSIGIAQSNKNNGDGKGIAMAGLIIGIVSTVMGFAVIIGIALSATPVENELWDDTINTTITWNNNYDY